MPQIIVDTATESPASLSLISRLLQDYAIMKAKDERAAETEYPTVAAHTHTGAPVAAAPALEDPAKLFAKPQATAPIAPSVAPLPLTVVPVAPAAGSTAPVTIPVATTVVPDTALAPVVERDTAGVPWDARIHSSAKGKKQDGTWKLARNIDKSLVTMVLHEITPKPHIVGGTVVPALQVTVPVAPAVPVSQEGSALPVAVPGTAPVVPVPVAPAAGAVPVAPNPVQLFQAMMQQISAAQAAGTLTPAVVLEAVKAEGLQQLQLLITAPEKIPLVKARLGLV